MNKTKKAYCPYCKKVVETYTEESSGYMSYDEYVDYINAPDNKKRITTRINSWNTGISSALQESMGEIVNQISYVIGLALILFGILFVFFSSRFDIDKYSFICFTAIFVFSGAFPFLVKNTIYRIILNNTMNKLYENILTSISYDIPEIRRHLKRDLTIAPIYKDKKEKRICGYEYKLSEIIMHDLEYYGYKFDSTSKSFKKQ